MEPPEDIVAALRGSAGAWERFERLPPPHKPECLTWIGEAKKPETRARRIAGMITQLGQRA